ncbi:MAG: hypothetical protein HDR04_13120 [Lachnospiraceae bacterium]|nr:hypothetical protein [Lachnospiraceae bacterium]
MTKAEYSAAQSEKFVDDTFDGSLPAFDGEAITIVESKGENKLEDFEILE